VGCGGGGGGGGGGGWVVGAGLGGGHTVRSVGSCEPTVVRTGTAAKHEAILCSRPSTLAEKQADERVLFDSVQKGTLNFRR